ncbi:MAG: hypothetical protein J5793_03165, partial [Clostridia bacterium]|nr:hypothetical protein [Clostridia bacterium]
MTALYIVAGVLLFIALLLACRVRARITYCRELVFTVRYLFLKREYRFAPSDGKEKHVKQTSAATKKEKK